MDFRVSGLKRETAHMFCVEYDRHYNDSLGDGLSYTHAVHDENNRKIQFCVINISTLCEINGKRIISTRF